jgi:hypothetical protein
MCNRYSPEVVDIGLLLCIAVWSEDGDSRFLPKRYQPANPHGVSTQKTNIEIFTVLRTSSHPKSNVTGGIRIDQELKHTFVVSSKKCAKSKTKH